MQTSSQIYASQHDIFILFKCNENDANESGMRVLSETDAIYVHYIGNDDR